MPHASRKPGHVRCVGIGRPARRRCRRGQRRPGAPARARGPSPPPSSARAPAGSRCGRPVEGVHDPHRWPWRDDHRTERGRGQPVATGERVGPGGRARRRRARCDAARTVAASPAPTSLPLRRHPRRDEHVQLAAHLAGLDRLAPLAASGDAHRQRIHAADSIATEHRPGARARCRRGRRSPSGRRDWGRSSARHPRGARPAGSTRRGRRRAVPIPATRRDPLQRGDRPGGDRTDALAPRDVDDRVRRGRRATADRSRRGSVPSSARTALRAARGTSGPPATRAERRWRSRSARGPLQIGRHRGSDRVERGIVRRGRSPGQTGVAQRRIGPSLPPTLRVPRRLGVTKQEDPGGHRPSQARHPSNSRGARPWPIPAPPPTRGLVVLRFFASAREAAGTGPRRSKARRSARCSPPRTARHGADFAAVLAGSRVWVNGEPARPTDHLRPGDEVAVLPPVSGNRVPRPTSPPAGRAHPGDATSPGVTNQNVVSLRGDEPKRDPRRREETARRKRPAGAKARQQVVERPPSALLGMAWAIVTGARADRRFGRVRPVDGRDRGARRAPGGAHVEGAIPPSIRSRRRLAAACRPRRGRRRVWRRPLQRCARRRPRGGRGACGHRAPRPTFPARSLCAASRRWPRRRPSCCGRPTGCSLVLVLLAFASVYDAAAT